MKSLVSIIMPVFNGQTYLAEAVDSMLCQTYDHFEFIIINDGSTDNTLNILRAYSDKRIKLIQNTTNQGLIYSLNRGLDEATGDYILRMDADDISYPNRIQTQVEFMEKNPLVGICGSYIKVFGEGIKTYIQKYDANPCMNEARLLFFPCLAHPSVIMRKSILNTYGLHYKENYPHAEDYAFWVEATQYTQISNIREVLLKYRVLSSSITRQADLNMESRLNVHKLIYCDYFKKYSFSLSEKELFMHFLISNNERFKHDRNDANASDIRKYMNIIQTVFKDSAICNYIAYVLNKRGLSLSRWYRRKNILYFFYYLCKYMYYKLKILF